MNETNVPMPCSGNESTLPDKQKSRQDRESHLRSLLKGISWRVIGTIDTMVISWFVTGSMVFAATIGSVEVITKLILYYFHERVWQLIPRGRVRRFWQFFGK